LVAVQLWTFYRAIHAESIEQRHAEFTRNMAHIGPPLGFRGVELPKAPDCGAELYACYGVKLPTKGLRFIGGYIYRGETYEYEDHGAFDDRMEFGFDSARRNINYQEILRVHFPIAVEAFRGYRAFCNIGFHALHYYKAAKNSDPFFQKLKENRGIDIDGRNYIYTLYSAQYWDALLCHQALGYGPDEVIDRIGDQALMTKRVLDGVYVLLNDDPAPTYESFVAMNAKFKPMLGIG
jgi:hypothetical protein